MRASAREEIVMEMDPLAVVLPQFALEEALAESDARDDAEAPHDANDRAAQREGSGDAPVADDAPP